MSQPINGGAQERVNQAVYARAGIAKHYRNRSFTPAEVACVIAYRDDIVDRDVLDVGVGSGRTTAVLQPLARRYEAVDYSSEMVATMRSEFPQVPVTEADFRDLATIPSASFDFVLATNNVISALSHEGRHAALSEASRVLRPGGLLALSSHNNNFARAQDPPRLVVARNPGRLLTNALQYARQTSNHLRLRSRHEIGNDYSVLTDVGHDYALLHYYATRALTERQLADVGLTCIEVFGEDGRALTTGSDDREHGSLFYVARAARPAQA